MNSLFSLDTLRKGQGCKYYLDYTIAINMHHSSIPTAVRHAEKRRTSTCAFADRIATVSIQHYRTVISTNPGEQTCIATIVAYNATTDTMQVLALGVGTKFLAESVVHQDYGYRVRDCHAEVLATRSFRRYLLQEMHAKKKSGSSILQKSKFGKHELVPNVTLHFYCSSAPCGNSVLKRFAKMKKEVYRSDLTDKEWPSDLDHNSIRGDSVQLGQFALLVKRDNSCDTNIRTRNKNVSVSKQKNWPVNCTDDWCPAGTAPTWSNRGSIHTCSDKLLRWNIFGLQGSLLSPLLTRPMYMSTLTVGRKMTRVISQRAVCCRLGECKNLAGSEYRVNHPTIMGTSVYLDESGTIDMSEARENGQDVRFHTSKCWAWWDGLKEPECIDGFTGYLYGSDCCHSSICTISLLELYCKVTDKALDVQSITLQDVQEFKMTHSQQHCELKTHLLKNHPVLKDWTRRVKDQVKDDNDH